MNKITSLKLDAIDIRRKLVQMIYESKTGHTGGSLSESDILAALFFYKLDIDPKNPDKPDRDIFILSKGHSVEAYFAALAKRGFFPVEDLKTFSQFDSQYIGHPNNKIPGIEVNSGALGHGLSIGVGSAIGMKKLGKKNKTYVLMGDGEQQEGSVWEAFMAGAYYKLDNLVAIVDRNYLQISGNTENVMGLDHLKEKYLSFNWEVLEINGNDMQEIVDALDHETKDKPLLILANTTKGKGIKEIENNASWHHKVPDEKTYQSAMEQFDIAEKELLNE